MQRVLCTFTSVALSHATFRAVQAHYTARLVNALSGALREALRSHPINIERADSGKRTADIVLLRGCGMRQALPAFEQRHGLRACIVAPTKVLGGTQVHLCE